MESAPSGSGFDNGTQFDFQRSKRNRLVFNTAYHHMNESGMYDGWTHHDVIITADLRFGCSIRMSGQDRNDFKSYAHEVFDVWITEEIEEYEPDGK